MNAMYVLLGLSVASAALLTVNVTASAAVMLATALLTPRETGRPSLAPAFITSAAHRATLLFRLRVLPALIAIGVVGLLCVPSYVAYEPGGTSERVGPVLAILATIALGFSVAAAWRAATCWRATRRLARKWRSAAQPLDLLGRQVTAWRHPAYRLDHAFPVMAVVGAFRPQLFISNAVLEALSDDELAAAVAHEHAHVVTADNLRGVLMRSASDVFGLSFLARRIDRLWAEAAEAAADESVARLGRDAALSLAAALLKITRLIPVGHTSAFSVIPPAMAGAFLIAPEHTTLTKGNSAANNTQHPYGAISGIRAGVAGRVRRLVELADNCPDSIAGQFSARDANPNASQDPSVRLAVLRHDSGTTRSALVLIAVSLLLGLSVAAMTPRLLATTHAVLEQFVHHVN